MAVRGNPTICIRLTPTQRENLQKIAADKGTNVSQLVRDAITDYLLKESK